MIDCNIPIYPINVQIAEKAARIRSEYIGFKGMDALQLATACLYGCDCFLTNDKQLKQFNEIKCVTVDEL
ncbi:MAG: PIN domain-containing protein [Clostridium sp.]|nr:PIN domain-containing protein [Clostridium sp.]